MAWLGGKPVPTRNFGVNGKCASPNLTIGIETSPTFRMSPRVMAENLEPDFGLNHPMILGVSIWKGPVSSMLLLLPLQKSFKDPVPLSYGFHYKSLTKKKGRPARQIQLRFVDRVLPNVGLCIEFYNFVSIKAGFGAGFVEGDGVPGGLN